MWLESQRTPKTGLMPKEPGDDGGGAKGHMCPESERGGGGNIQESKGD